MPVGPAVVATVSDVERHERLHKFVVRHRPAPVAVQQFEQRIEIVLKKREEKKA